ncbi:calcium-transporting P-type ATPase, PMR1-type [Candidatus Woesearchaeota archaeon]|nr:calcium-transporting P-type ATPase, PMR1-type [Candidatus Woesearchaeota archaeon]
MEFYNKKIDFVFSELGSSKNGLSPEEAATRLEKYGRNEITKKHEISKLKIFLEQFKDFIIWILIIATIISAVLGEWVDALAIGIILLLNALLGFIQEYKAEEAIEKLKQLASLKAFVFRNGQEMEIDATEVVPGDIILLTEGDKVPADARLFEQHSLYSQEAALTGESMPVSKNTDVLEKAAVADQANMVFAGTVVTRGNGKAVVVRTAMDTELGKIATLIEETKQPPTPLQVKLDHFGKLLGILVLAIAAVVFVVGVVRGFPAFEMFLAAVSLAVAAIPEGLPAVVTITLALGVQRMIKRNTLVRRLPSVETLGSTTVICSDKTGTFTHNEMTVQKVYVDDKIINVTGSGYEPKGKFSETPEGLKQLLKIGVLCNDANIDESGKVFGDPTEAALIVSAMKLGIGKRELENENPRVDEIPFSSERKRMTTVHKVAGKKFAFVKGSPEVIVERCSKILENGKARYITPVDKKKILDKNDEFASQALRVLGFAYKEVEAQTPESNLIFVGLQAMIDPARNEAIIAVNQCRNAGIKVVMITGDHKLTARAVADQLGIIGRALTGQELDKLNDKELYNIVDDVSIYARVNPIHKVKIVEALKKRGHIVAMTGDGVNDAPSLKKADICVAMGITGTDVSKEAADMILVDDNFASMVAAVEEGRGIYDNIEKFIQYLLSCNMGEVLTIFVAIILGLSLPLIALQILLMNLLTDGLPALALGIEPKEEGIMARGPRKPGKKIVDAPALVNMLIFGLIMMAGTLFMFQFARPEQNLNYARTVAFTTLVFFQMFHVLNSRSLTHSIFKIGFFSNWKLWAAIAVSVLIQVAVIYVPGINSVFQTVPLLWQDWLYIMLVASSIFFIREIWKLFRK